jgi:hypothetical protein
MEKKRNDDYEPGPVPSPRGLDRFGFIKQDASTSEGGVKTSRSAYEYERYFFFRTALSVSVFLSVNE